MPLTQWATDDELTAARLNEMVDAYNNFEALAGGTFTNALTVTTSHASTPTITATQNNASGVIAKFVDAAAATALQVMQTGVFVPTAPFIMGNGTSPVTGITAGVYKTVASGPAITMDVLLNTTTTGEDHGAFRAVAKQLTTGSSHIRAGEFHALRTAGVSSKTTWGLEVSSNSTVAGDGTSYTGIYAYGDNVLWGIGAAVTGDDGIRIGGTNGWTNGWRYLHTDGVTVLGRMVGLTSGSDLLGDLMAGGRVYSSGVGANRVGMLNPGAVATAGHTWGGMWYDATAGVTALVIEANTNGTGYRNVLINSVAGGNLGIGGSSYGSGVGVVFLKNAGTNPSTNPTAGAILYADGGALKGRGSGGTVTTMAASEPHCPRCDADFALQWENPKYGGTLAICVKCLTGALERIGLSAEEYAIAMPFD